MLYLIHTIIGILIAKNSQSLWLIAILAIVSHFLLDMIPHRDSIFKPNQFKKFDGKIPKDNKAIAFELIDTGISLSLIIFFVLKFNNPLIIWGAFFSLFPDIVKLLYLTPIRKTNLFQGYIHFHLKIQKEISWTAGIIIQLVIFILAFYLSIVF